MAKLAGALDFHGISCHLLDMNLEGLLSLLGHPLPASDTWSRRALKDISKNIAALRDPRTYRSFDRYSRAVMDVNRVLEISGRGLGVVSGLADYQDPALSPVRSADLITAAEHPERNLFYSYFKKRLPEVIGQAFAPGREREPAREQKKNVIGISLNYLSQALCAFSMIGFVRKEFPVMKIVLGGGLVTSWMKRPGWESPFGGLVDHLVAGPGEQALLSLHGIQDAGHQFFLPEYGSLPHENYVSPGFVLPYSGSSGCYWNRCSFCPEPAEENPYTPAPPERVIADLHSLVEKTRPALLHLLDNAVNPAMLRALAAGPVGVPWYGFARINAALLDLDFCMALKSSGCVMLKVGLESGDQGVLDAMQKGLDLETASKVFRNLKKAGIAAYVYLLFGTPSETIAEARKTLDFVVQHRAAITFLNLAIFNMPVCSKEAGAYETEPFYEGDLSLYRDFRHPGGWGRKQVRQFLDREFKRDKAIASILKNDPPFFTSNHAAFFVHAAGSRTGHDPE
jgi:radical SAM superfamily enzyme YgiQ (UPF0313 family)